MEHPLFEIVKTTAGAVSIRNKAVNEIMHNPVGPWAEANALYIHQAGLKDRLTTQESQPLVVFDVGLGAAANALAAIHCSNGIPEGRKLVLVSFERDLELLRFALDHADRFDHFKGYEAAIKKLLEKGLWENASVSWELRHGDFLQLIDSEPRRAHLIFYDPYSPLVNLEMWSLECFKKLRRKCHNSKNGGAVLFTYSQATPVRVALLAAGFFVGVGAATGLKPETTQAATLFDDLADPLGARWIERWRKSDTPFPLGCKPEQKDEVTHSILSHPQFQPV